MQRPSLRLNRDFTSTRNSRAALCLGLLLSIPTLGLNLPLVAAQVSAPLDLVSDIPDPNGLLLNPRWRWQLTNNDLPDPNKLCFAAGKFGGCTSEPVEFDEPGLPNSLTCALGEGTSIKGHINWRPATFAGRIDWGEYSIDGDYSFELTPANRNALTAHRDSLHVKFAADETVKHFNTPWWKEFRKIVGRRLGGPNEKAREFIKANRAVVIGLVSLDCVHGCYTELHPVYAMAINVETKVNASEGTVDEVWAIFARNWGDQGWCSKDQHYLNLESSSNKISLLLPWGPDPASGVTDASFEAVLGGTRFLSNDVRATGPEVIRGGNQGLMVTFNLPKARERARIHGELHLRWKFTKPLGGKPVPVPSSSTTKAAVTSGSKESEERLLLEALGDEGRKRLAEEPEAGAPDLVPRKARVNLDEKPARGFLSIFDKLNQTMIIQPAPPAKAPSMETELDAEKAERDKRLLTAPPAAP
jgi:hypothetical protein